MLLTLFYVISSYLKMWHLQAVRTKLLQHISSTSCVSFYKCSNVPQEFVGASSPLCTDPEKAHISDLLFAKGVAYGCALSPLQRISLTSWRSPPKEPTRIAFLPSTRPASFLRASARAELTEPSTSADVPRRENIEILLECELENEDPENINILPVNNENDDVWKIVAWKMKGSRLALALLGDVSQLTVLVSTFLNYETPIMRIMTVKFDDAPKFLTEDENNALSRGNINGSPRHCSKYINMLRTITNSTYENDDGLQKENVFCESDPNQLNGSISLPVEESPRKDNKKNNEVVDNHQSTSTNHTVKKSDLKLELSNKSTDNKKPPKTIKISKIETVDKKSYPIEERNSTKEKFNKSCPSLPIVKPPNILIYSDSAVTRDNISKTLRSVLDPDRYAIYASGDEAKIETAGASCSVLLVVGGALTPRASVALLSAFLNGACILSLCSDLLISVLPFYQTAEVRERELVSFSYEKWKSVKLLHNVFCYQASPARRQFSSGSNPHPSEYKGHGGHNLKVKILAAEQTWHTPSLLRATDEISGGMAVFSQVHLELDSREYLGSDAISSEKARLGVLRSILDSLGLITASSPIAPIISSEPCYTPAYFLGTYERKQEAAEAVAVGRLQLVLPKNTPPAASSTILPLLLHACPENFSTLLYFQDLMTKDLGRLVIYSEILPSTQDVINEQVRVHGLVIVADRQIKGQGRGGTVWLSPPGCVMFSLQIISNMDCVIASRAGLIQHIAALSCVSAIKSIPGYEDLDLRIKWPNDLYYGKNIKLGGIIVNTTVLGKEIVFNIGIGLNLDNKIPTLCLNHIIKNYNKDLEILHREKVIACILNSLEKYYENILKTNDFTEFYRDYYKFWMHTNQEIVVIQEEVEENESLKCRIIGIDDHGYLEADGPLGKVSLRPDGNTFDMMKGLIAPKLSS